MNDLRKRLETYEPLWGEWKIGRLLYAGNGSSVYELFRIRCDKQLTCALKVLEILPYDTREISEKFAKAMDEIERMEFLSKNEHIVSICDDSIHEIFSDTGNLKGYDVLIRMEYLTCLNDLIREGTILSEDEIEKIGIELCNAITYAHKHGLVHRDIKPANIYRSPSGDYKLGDFGTAARKPNELSLKTITGTTAYMAPEVSKGEPYDQRADIYSLGIVLYQLLENNFLPFTNDSSSYSERKSAIRKRLNGMDLPLCSRGSRSFIKAVMKACHPKPEKRFQTANDFSSAIINNKKRCISSTFVACLCTLCLVIGLFSSFVYLRYFNTRMYHDTSYELPHKSKYEVVAINMTWENAKVYCESRGGHLATITSRQEESTIIKLLNEKGMTSAWIGANNRNVSRGFVWLTGERFSYAPWGLGEPNSTNGIEYYVMMQLRDGQWIWNDSRDDGLNNFKFGTVGFVCEWAEDHE